MHEAIEDGVGERRIADDLVPVLAGQLAGNGRGAMAMTVGEQLEQIAAGLGADGTQPPVVEHDQAGPGVGVGQGILEQPGSAQVAGGVALTSGFVGEPSLVHAGGPEDEHVECLADPLAGGEGRWRAG